MAHIRPAERRPIVLGITGASGAVYAVRLLEVLLASGRDVHLAISPSAVLVAKQELGVELNLSRFELEQLSPALATMIAKGEDFGRLTYHRHDDFLAPIASGSFLTAGMVICPCSGGALSGVSGGASRNLIQRAADVHLKERRKLILVPRETPLSIVHLENMKRACEVGAIVLPASPGWYHGVRSINDLVDFIVARILDQLGIEHQLMKRWGEEESDKREQL
jgi:4-hydroxy-3-polyprenylbenzoate decarboxylase